MLGTWLQLVNEFTRLDITRELDKLLAVSKLASCLSKQFGSPYIAGLWQDDLGQGLLWRRPPYQ
jgi:hypothetical protein